MGCLLMPKAQPGQRWRPPAASEHNAMLEVAEWYNRRRRLSEGGAQSRKPIPTDCVIIKNTSGSNRSRGDAMEISGLQTTAIEVEGITVTGITPTAAGKSFGILRSAIPNNQFGVAQVSGVCLARVDVTDANHTRAKLAASTNTLVSTMDGPVRVVYKPSGTGIKECVVSLYDNWAYKSLVRFTLNAALATSDASKTGTIQSQYGPGIDSPDTGSGAITLNNLLTSAASTYLFAAASGAAGYALWDSGTNYRIIAIETYKPLIRFTLAAALATTDASKTATITNQYGPGLVSPNTGAGAITVNNFLVSGSTYLFEGLSGTAGLAIWDSGTNYRIIQMVCP